MIKVCCTLVHGLIVGPTPNPFASFLLSKILLRRKDLPVLYLPATAIIPIFSLMPPNKAIASGLTWKPINLLHLKFTFLGIISNQIDCFFLYLIIFLEYLLIFHLRN